MKPPDRELTIQIVSLVVLALALLYAVASSVTIARWEKALPEAARALRKRRVQQRAFCAAAQVVTGAVVIAIFFALGLLRRPPFGPGNDVGQGLLLGLAGATLCFLVSRWLSARTYEPEDYDPSSVPPQPVSPVAASVFLIVPLAVWAPLLALASGPRWPSIILIAVSVGSLAALTFTYLSPALAPRQESSPAISPLALYAILTAVLASACALASLAGLPRHVYVAPTESRDLVEALPPLLAVNMLLLALMLVFAAYVWAKGGMSTLADAARVLILASALGLWAVDWAMRRVMADQQYLIPALTGAVSALILFVLFAQIPGEAAANPSTARSTFALETSALAVLVVLGTALAAFRARAGHGVAVAALSFLPAASLACIGSQSPTASPQVRERFRIVWQGMTYAMAILALVVLFRVFVERYRLSGRELSLTHYHTLIGLTLGILLPVFTSIIAGSHSGRRAGIAANLSHTILVAFTACAVPIALANALTLTTTAALLLGLTGSLALLMVLNLAEAGRAASTEKPHPLAHPAAPFVALLASATAVLFSGIAHDLSGKWRLWHKWVLIGAIALVLIVWQLLRARAESRAAVVSTPGGSG